MHITLVKLHRWFWQKLTVRKMCCEVLTFHFLFCCLHEHEYYLELKLESQNPSWTSAFAARRTPQRVRIGVGKEFEKKNDIKISSAQRGHEFLTVSTPKTKKTYGTNRRNIQSYKKSQLDIRYDYGKYSKFIIYHACPFIPFYTFLKSFDKWYHIEHLYRSKRTIKTQYKKFQLEEKEKRRSDWDWFKRRRKWINWEL